jgi:hypothetical protein
MRAIKVPLPMSFNTAQSSPEYFLVNETADPGLPVSGGFKCQALKNLAQLFCWVSFRFS